MLEKLTRGTFKTMETILPFSIFSVSKFYFKDIVTTKITSERASSGRHVLFNLAGRVISILNLFFIKSFLSLNLSVDKTTPA